MGKTTKAEKMQAAQTRDVMISDMDAIYEANLREYAQGVVPGLIEGSLTDMAKGTQWIYDEEGKVERDKHGVKQFTGQHVSQNLQRSAILDLVDLAKKPAPKNSLEQLAARAAGGSGGFHITIVQSRPKDEAAETLEDVLANALDVTPIKEEEGDGQE